MKQIALLIGLACLGMLTFAAVPTSVSYTEGSVSLKPQSGALRDLQIGDALKTGDTIRTGKDGLAELDQGGVILKIQASTVFTLLEKEQGGQKRSVVAVALGSVKMRYDKLTGQEPLVKTASAQAGVRGTELTVVSGADGASLILVDKGLVDVTAEGQTVALVAGEGVEVQPGKAPGVKFTLDMSHTDYSKWSNDKVTKMLADPVTALVSIKAQMESYEKVIGDYDNLFKDAFGKLEAARKSLDDIAKTKGKAEADKYQNEVIDPLTILATNLNLNKRFEAISALSLRYYVLGRLNVQLKPQFIMGKPDWEQAYQKIYDQILADFEQTVIPHLSVYNI